MFHYEMDGERYILVDDRNQIHASHDEIAVAFSFDPTDPIPGTLHKHGSFENVNKWAQEAIAKLSVNCKDLASQITVVSGKIPLEEINRMIDISGYVGTWYKKILANGGDLSASIYKTPYEV